MYTFSPWDYTIDLMTVDVKSIITAAKKLAAQSLVSEQKYFITPRVCVPFEGLLVSNLLEL